MFSDIVGFSAMMGKDESHAIDQIAKWKIIHQSYISKHKGTPIKEIGDGFLVTFDNCFDAVSCALDIKDRLGQEPLLKVRIGIHLAEILFQNNDIIGDGVNIAARIEQNAPTGSIHVSEQVHMNLKNKKEFQFDEKGSKSFKNIDSPIKIFDVKRPIQFQESAVQTGEINGVRIGILPFKSKSYDDLSEEISESIYEILSQDKNIAILAPSRVDSILKSGNELYSELGKINTEFLIEGKISEKENMVGILIRVVSVESGYQLHSKTFKMTKSSIADEFEALMKDVSDFLISALEK